MLYDMTTRLGDRITYEIPTGSRVTAGYWALPDTDTSTLSPDELAAESTRPADFEITYPLGESCFPWKHFLPNGDLHSSSANQISFDGKTLRLTQFLNLDCSAAEGPGEDKALTSAPGPDTPNTLISKVLRSEDFE